MTTESPILSLDNHVLDFSALEMPIDSTGSNAQHTLPQSGALSPQERATDFLRRYQTSSSVLITGSYLQLQDVLLRLSELTDAMMLAHQKDYVAAYKDHMVKVQCELIHVKKHNSDFYLKMARDERMRYLEQTIQWLRTEALSLAKSIQELKSQNERLRRDLDQDRDERRFLVEYTRSTRRHNRLLSQTIEQLKDGVIRQKYEKNYNSLHQSKPLNGIASSSMFSNSQEPTIVTQGGGRASTANETVKPAQHI